jgi:hypothetical protein
MPTPLPHTRTLEALNAICVANGGAGGHTRWINALNEWCTRISVTAGHASVIAAYNAIASKTGGATTFKRRVDAINNIAGDRSTATTAQSSFEGLANVAETYTTLALTSISPTTMVHDSGEQTLACIGTHFIDGDKIFIGTDEMVTTFVNNLRLTCTVDTADYEAGTEDVTVKHGVTATSAVELTIT